MDDNTSATIRRLEHQVVQLWRLLDDIDTLDDAAKGDDEAFRNATRILQRKRFDYVSGEEFDRLSAE